MRVLLALNESLDGASVKHEAASRAWPAGTAVRVLAVLQEQLPVLPGPPSSTPIVVYPAVGDAAQGPILAEAAAIADTLAHKPDELRLSVETSVRRGTPGPEIVDEARLWAADLIVLGADSRGGLERVFRRDIDHYVVSHAPCSVEVVRSPMTGRP